MIHEWLDRGDGFPVRDEWDTLRDQKRGLEEKSRADQRSANGSMRAQAALFAISDSRASRASSSEDWMWWITNSNGWLLLAVGQRPRSGSRQDR